MKLINSLKKYNQCSTKLETLDKMDDFLHKDYLPKLNQDQVNYVSSPKTPKEIEAAIKILQTKKSSESDNFSIEFYKTFKKS